MDRRSLLVFKRFKFVLPRRESTLGVDGGRPAALHVLFRRCRQQIQHRPSVFLKAKRKSRL